MVWRFPIWEIRSNNYHVNIILQVQKTRTQLVYYPPPLTTTNRAPSLPLFLDGARGGGGCYCIAVLASLEPEPPFSATARAGGGSVSSFGFSYKIQNNGMWRTIRDCRSIKFFFIFIAVRIRNTDPDPQKFLNKGSNLYQDQDPQHWSDTQKKLSGSP